MQELCRLPQPVSGPTYTTKYHKGEGLPRPIISKPHSFRNADRLIDRMEKWMVLAFPSIGN